MCCVSIWKAFLIPEIWVGSPSKPESKSLRKTTRDIPVYDDLMRLRLGHSRRASDRSRHDPLGHRNARTACPVQSSFSTGREARFQVAIVSDTFYEFAQPMMAKLGWPMLLCHRLEVVRGRDRRLSNSSARSEAAVGQSVSVAALSSTGGRRFIQRHSDAGSGRSRASSIVVQPRSPPNIRSSRGPKATVHCRNCWLRAQPSPEAGVRSVSISAISVAAIESATMPPPPQVWTPVGVKASVRIAMFVSSAPLRSIHP